MKLSTLRRRAACALLTLLIPAALAVPAAASHRGAVTLYKHVHFRGHSETFDRDVPNLGWTSIGNDRASSIAVAPGCVVTLYRDADFHGPAITVHHDVDDLGATWLGNDEVSSLAVDCDGRGYRRGGAYERGGVYERGGDGYRHRRGRGGVTVFEDTGFRGLSETFSYGDRDLRDNFIDQDTISSVVVSPGCRAVLFADVGFRGAATEVTGSDPNLGYSAVGNDRVSSIQVDCQGYGRPFAR